MDDTDNAEWHLYFSDKFAELDRVMRCFLDGLGHNSVAGNECKSDFASNQKNGEVPKKDPTHDADGLSIEEMISRRRSLSRISPSIRRSHSAI